jgi:DNA-binding MurR/RpiR family transcriptional regulator
VKIAKENSVPVICITSNQNSPLARLSDFSLIAGVSGSAEGDMANEIRNSQLALIDALTAYLKSAIDDGKYSKIKSIISSHNVEEH